MSNSVRSIADILMMTYYEYNFFISLLLVILEAVLVSLCESLEFNYQIMATHRQPFDIAGVVVLVYCPIKRLFT